MKAKYVIDKFTFEINNLKNDPNDKNDKNN